MVSFLLKATTIDSPSIMLYSYTDFLFHIPLGSCGGVPVCRNRCCFPSPAPVSVGEMMIHDVLFTVQLPWKTVLC